MSPLTRSRENVVDTVADAVALRILRGELAPGSRLPSVRALAAEHGVNVSTVQRVLARLEESGMVVTKPRSGIEVRDPTRHGGAAWWPLMLRHAAEHTERAVALLRDGFAARRVLSAEVFRALLEAPRARYADALDAAIDAFAEVVRDARDDPAALAASENEIVRTALIAAGRPAVLAIYNDITDMMLANGSVLEAMYTAPEIHLSGWRSFAELLKKGGPAARYAELEPLLRATDEHVVATFAASLGVKARISEPPRTRGTAAKATRRTKI